VGIHFLAEPVDLDDGKLIKTMGGAGSAGFARAQGCGRAETKHLGSLAGEQGFDDCRDRRRTFVRPEFGECKAAMCWDAPLASTTRRAGHEPMFFRSCSRLNEECGA